MIKGETTFTLYRANGDGYDRFVIPNSHWQECKASNVIKSGLQNADSVVIYIPYSSIYVDDVDVTPQNTSKDMIVKGVCDFVFDNTFDQSISESFREFKRKYKPLTVNSIDRKLYGSKALQHIKISAGQVIL